VVLDEMRDYFEHLAAHLQSALRGRESYELNLHAEESDFVRLNRGAVRQAGAVTQRSLSVDLAEGRRHAAGSLTVSGEVAADTGRLGALVETLREQRAELPEDPFLIVPDEARSGERLVASALPDAGEVLDCVTETAAGRDLVGLYAAGPIHRGFASSSGQRNWFSCASFNFDWSFYLQADRAVKASYAGLAWQRAELERKVTRAAQQLDQVARPTRDLPPGRYAVHLAPAAVADLLGLLCWGGFGLRALRTKTSPLLGMTEAGERLASAVTIVEDTAGGLAPGFQEQGFLRPDHVTLIEAGIHRDSLVSPRSAAEFGAVSNGASSHEVPLSLDMAPGDVPEADVLRRLGTGIHVSNLHYLNYSDRNRCRATGMTRFACFWVENGAIVAPIGVLRFDDTVYRMLGSRLVGLTAERDTLLDPNTYGGRSVDSMRVPGALIDEVAFTL
jgi:predicted Zn-dependent protease